MDKAEVKIRIEKLRKYIDEMRYRYHVLDDPAVTDADYDSLMRELVALEQAHPEFYDPLSPSQRIGGEPLKKFQESRHYVSMLSLNDAFSREEIGAWYKRLSRLVNHQMIDRSGFYCEMKMDGLAVNLVYERGELVLGSTRGNGIVGEDITQNLKTIQAIPLKLRSESRYFSLAKSKRIIVRGEAFISLKNFEILNRERKEQGKILFANPRNAAAGSLRQLDPKITARRHLDFMAYGLIIINEGPGQMGTTDIIKTHEEEHQMSSDFGFPTNGHNRFCRSIDAVIKLWQEWEKKRKKLPYQIDGMVVNVNDLKLFARLGVIGKSPRGAIALKWPALEVTTTIEDIQVQVGRTGTLTPVAHLRPIEVAGSTVSRATLHNIDEIERKDIRIGDTVVIRKAGDVIPEVVKSIKELRTGKEGNFRMPKSCPVCGSRIIRRQGEVAYRCANRDCFAIQKLKIGHFVAKSAFDIEGLGPKIIDRLIDKGLIKDASDLFELKTGDLEPLERFAEKSAQNLIDSIRGAREIELDRFIYALGIPMVGSETAADLAEQFGTLKKFLRASREEFDRMYGIGKKVADSIFDWLKAGKNHQFIKRLIYRGVKIKKYHSPVSANKFDGKSFVVTGVLPTMTRNETHKKIIQYGGRVASSVTSKTDFVIVGEEPGSKLERAQKLGIRTLTEEEFLRMIK